MTLHMRDALIGQIEIFEALERAAEQDYGRIVQDLSPFEFKKTIETIRLDEVEHAQICLEIIEFLRNAPER